MRTTPLPPADHPAPAAFPPALPADQAPDPSPALTIVPALPHHLAFAAAMAVEASTPPFPRSFWADVAEPLGCPPAALVEAALRDGIYVWGRAEDFIVLLAGDEPVAACAVYPSSPAVLGAPLRREGVPDLLARLCPDPEGRRAALAVYDGIWAGAEETPFGRSHVPWVIETVAVAPHARGRGYLRPLFEAAFAKARAAGAGEIGLSVILGNGGALRAYERLGFRVTGTYGPDAFGGGEFPGIHTMARPLAP